MKQQLESTNRAFKLNQNELLSNHIPKQQIILNETNNGRRNPSPATNKKKISNSLH